MYKRKYIRAGPLRVRTAMGSRVRSGPELMKADRLWCAAAGAHHHHHSAPSQKSYYSYIALALSHPK